MAIFGVTKSRMMAAGTSHIPVPRQYRIPEQQPAQRHFIGAERIVRGGIDVLRQGGKSVSASVLALAFQGRIKKQKQGRTAAQDKDVQFFHRPERAHELTHPRSTFRPPSDDTPSAIVPPVASTISRAIARPNT